LYPSWIDDQQGKPLKKDDVWYALMEMTVANKRVFVRVQFQGPPIFLQDVDDFVILATAKQLIVWSKKDRKVFSDLRFNDPDLPDERLVVVAVDACKKVAATADVRGNIFLYHSLMTKPVQWNSSLSKKKHGLSRAELTKWHAHGVMTMRFSPDGSHLLTGGEEGVLVINQVGTSARTFLPRLGAPLCAIGHSHDGTLCAITTQANKVLLINPIDLRVRWEYKAVSIRPFDRPCHDNMSGLVRLWGVGGGGHLGDVVVNGAGGLLQFVDVYQEMVVGELEVVKWNRVSRNDQHVIMPPWVTHCALSSVGQRVVTMDVRVGEENIRKVAMKFWEYDQPNKRYILSACVEDPHGGADVCSVVYHPTSDMVASSGSNGVFKLWSMDMKENGESSAWRCHACVNYRPYAAAAMSFSEDGSVLAVAYGPLVTLWDPSDVRLLGTIQTNLNSLAVNRVHFLQCAPYILTTTSGSLCLWDALTLAKKWEYEAQVDSVAITGAQKGGSVLELPGSSERIDFVVATTEGRGGGGGGGNKNKNENGGVGHHHRDPMRFAVHFFNMASPIPVYSQQVPHRLRSMSIVTGKKGRSPGVACHSKHEGVIFLTGRTITTSKPITIPAPLPVNGRKRSLNAVELVQPSAANQAKRVVMPSLQPMTNAVPLSDLLDPTTSTLPTPSTLYSSFLKGLLPTASSTKTSHFLVQQDDEERVEKLLPPSLPPSSAANATVIADTVGVDAQSQEPVKSPPSLPSCGVRVELLQLFKETFKG